MEEGGPSETNNMEIILHPIPLSTSPSANMMRNVMQLSTPPHVIPNHEREWIPFCPDDVKPKVGMRFQTLEQAITFYDNYAKICGFSTRSGSTKRDKIENTILFKYCLCNKEGFKDSPKVVEENLNGGNKRRRTLTRVGCKARLTLKLCKGEGYMVFAFHEGHTHVLATPTSMHHTKQSRKLSFAHKKFVINNGKANVGSTKSYRLMKEHLGSYENIGASMDDFKNFQRDVRKYIKGKDAQMLIDNFKRKKELCDSFFFDYEVDEKSFLTKVFWADTVARKNYSAFGDVVSFDSTYSMNSYSMVFAPFTGVNNNKSCVTFAAGLIAKEDVESFEWLFKTFRVAMSYCDPVCLITDQDPAMKIAFEKVFDKDKTKHRLCMWHIMKKVTEKVSPTVEKDKMEDFLSSFCGCVWSKESEPEEFDVYWNAILEEYGLTNNKWLQDMFEIRHSWIPAYYRDVSMSGILRTTSRSESENNFFGHFTTPHLTLFEFWMRYQTAMDVQRHKQSKLMYDCNNSTPKRKTPLDLEIHALKVYTHSIFYDFQVELVAACFDCGCQGMEKDDHIENISIIDRKRNNKCFMIDFNEREMLANCSCKMFQREGILCRHILCVLKDKGFKFIPERYILSRWTKTAMSMPMFDLGGNLIEDTSKLNDVKKKVGDLWEDIFSCVTLAEQNEEHLDEFLKMVRSFKQDLMAKESCVIPSDKTKEIEKLLDCPIPTEITILDPNKCKNKGTQKRMKGKKEEAIDQNKKPPRVCRLCGELSHHDSRNCPTKKAV